MNRGILFDIPNVHALRAEKVRITLDYVVLGKGRIAKAHN